MKQVINLKVRNENNGTNSNTELISYLINKVVNNVNLNMTVSDIISMMSSDMEFSKIPEFHFWNNTLVLVICDKDIDIALNHPRWFKAMSE